MKFEQFPEEQKTEEEKDKENAENLQLKLEKIKSFEASGDIIADFNHLLDLMGRDKSQRADVDEDPILVKIRVQNTRDVWQEILMDPDELKDANEAKKLLYIDVPNAEIDALDKIINSYSDKFFERNEKRNKFESEYLE
ncbi:MAG: hypothetical protein WC998_01905 [Candidatus Paceibacterota bacterium]|jgi:hypothetical protein